MDTSSLIPRLMSEFGYPYQGAQLVATKLQGLTSHIRPLFDQWWATGTMTDEAVEGYTLTHLIEKHGMNVIAAFLTLDWLVRDPERAKASLQKGHDTVQFSNRTG